MKAFLKKLHRNEEGQDLIEYALLAALIAVALVASGILGNLADAIEGAFQNVIDEL